ncbi:EAL domain-containing protein [Singulisphaera sp. PoT]|uniref:EAL domain-containing protein n=1 Tax=Singulisphaera sp. PoT TaxID=3411797 RepID=UPI003BF52D47
MPLCLKCTGPPAAIPETGTLCLAPPLVHTLRTLRTLLKRIDLPFEEPAGHLLSVDLKHGKLGQLADELVRALSQSELRDTKSLIVGEGAAFALSDIAAIQPLSSLVTRVRSAWFFEMLGEGRLTSHFQPIVHAQDPGHVFAYECLLRGVEAGGKLVPPGRLFEAARDAEMLFPLDRAARLTAIRCASENGLDRGDSNLFINFNPASIYDPRYCLAATVAAIRETGYRPDRVVFEVVESDEVKDVDHLVRIANYYREAGFKVALDDLGSGYGSLNLLGILKPDFVKLDMHLIRGVDREAYKAGILSKLLEMSQSLGIESVAEGIETEGEYAWVREHGADYVQGFLFGKPMNPPPLPQRTDELVAHATHR